MIGSDMDSDNISMLVGETFGQAIIDTGCPKTVCGAEWFNVYLESLSSKDRAHIRHKRSSNKFRFGDGKIYRSKNRYTLPIFIGGEKQFLRVDVIDLCIPLLISRSSLERANARIDIGNGTITLLGTEVPLTTSNSGHLCLSIGRSQYDHDHTETKRVFSSLFSSPFGMYSDLDDLKRKVTKLHTQFAHPHPDRLIKLVKDSGIDDPKVVSAIKEVSSQCDTCRRFKKKPLKPAVGFPLASEFNQTVALDLKQFGPNLYILHMVDHLSRYGSACVIRNKKKETIVKGILEYWVRIFGSPNKFLSDNGGEFVNKDLTDFAEKYNVTIKTTAAESAWSNGLVEKHNGLLANVIDKIMDDDKECPLDIAVHWACAAKNSLSNVYGFSPNIIVFGRNPNYPSVMSNKPPGNNPTCISEYIAQNLNAMYIARQALVEQESSEKLRRALCRKSRSYSDSVYCQGDLVYYWRDNSQSCHGPATVVGKDCQQVLLKHGGSYLRVHPCRLQHYKNDSNTSSTDVSPTQTSSHVSTADGIPNSLVTSEPDDETDSNDDSPPDISPTSSNTLVAPNPDSNSSNWTTVKSKQDLPKPNSSIECLFPGNESPIQCTVISKGGKSSTSNWHYLNIQEEEQSHGKCCSFKNVSWRPTDNQEDSTSAVEETFFTSSDDDVQFKAAKQEEIQKWKDFDTFSEVPNQGQRTISTRWVCTRKLKGSHVVNKARLVARGFEEDTKSLKTDSPTCSKECLRLLLAIVAANSWTLHSLDVKSAFLQGIEMTREVFIKPPKEANTDMLWKCKKAPYGLGDAGRHWYLRVLKELLAAGFIQCSYDKAIFMCYLEQQLIGIIACHVDDLLFGGTDYFHQNIVSRIRSVFVIGSEENTKLKYLGLQIEQSSSGISLSAKQYAVSVKQVDLTSAESHDEKVKCCKQFAGQINWLVGQARPDLAFASCAFSNCINTDLEKCSAMSNKIVRKINNQDVTLHFYNDIDITNIRVVTFCDASFKNLPNCGSQGGFISFLVDEQGNYCSLSWQSRKVRRVVKSTIAAESLAALEAAEMTVYLVSVIKDILCLKQVDSIIICDNRS